MLDSKLLRSQLDTIVERLGTRAFMLDVASFYQLEDERKRLQTSVEALQAKRNSLAKQIGMAKASEQNTEALLAESLDINQQLTALETQLLATQEQLQHFLLCLPNLPDVFVPIGKDASDNQEIRRVGTPKKFNFVPKDHVALGEALHQMDFETASKLSGARFVVLKNELARLHRALAQFMLDVHTREHGYSEYYVPYLVKSACYYGTGQLPKFHEDFFSLQGDHDLNLISTAEIALSNTLREETVDEAVLPIRLTAHTPCFRSEAGSYGKDTRGMIRQHQFDKVELVQFVHPDQSAATLETMTQHAAVILERLELPYRVMLLCTGDLGFSAAKTYDLEVWLPSQNTYREISSCSNCTDFQARRMQTRFRDKLTHKSALLHTLNGSGVAVGRALVAVLENHQDENGNIHIPKALQPYFQQEIIHGILKR